MTADGATGENAVLFEVMRLGLITTGVEDGRVRRVNKSTCELLGRDESDIVGRDWRELVDPRQLDELVTVEDETRPGEMEGTCWVVRFARPDGTVVHTLAAGTIVPWDGESCYLVQLMDITELVSTELQLRLVLDHTPATIFLLDRAGRVLVCGGEPSQPPAAALRRALASSVYDVLAECPELLTLVHRAIAGERAHTVIEARRRWYDLHLVPVPGAAASGPGPAVGGVALEVTDLRVRAARQTALVDLAQHALEITDAGSVYEHATRILAAHLPADEVTIQPYRAADESPAAATGTAGTSGARASGGGNEPPVEGTSEVMRILVGRADDPVAEIMVRRDGRGFGPDSLEFVRAVAAIVGTAVMRIRTEGDARYRAWHDPLTGLANRTALLDRLERGLRRARADRRTIGVLFLDLDGFKAVNDTLGHQAGDDLLRIVADRLQRAVRPDDVVGRLAGDEFAVMCDAISWADLRAIAGRVLTALAEPAALGRTVRLGGSIGLALSGPGLADAEELLNAADMAMYDAKQSGPGRCVAYDEHIRAGLDAKLRDTTELRDALSDGGLGVCVEPIAAHGGEVVGVEAVPYWQHPRRGRLGPDEIERIAREAGLTGELDRWLVEHATASIAAAHVQLRRRPLWLRISERGATDPELRGAIARQVGAAHATDTPELTVLLPDEMVQRDRATADAIAAEFDRAGVGVGMDFTDIGPLRATMEDIIPAKIGVVRLGASYVRGIDKGGIPLATLTGIVQFAHVLNLRVAVRSVDTPQELAAVRTLGCDLVQGTAVRTGVPA
ncbi:diguanylate cyclase [Frankia sp. AgB1.9]|uniref:diguanylate cyclase domain-containing protein n=1 Tax=unclassified Frankia TaxID=2632575 RepID=UPI0019335E18|nr:MULTISPECIES: diguanylate cyclase [unclassified Frankia]MBL7549429.1 diguanylate cyclase [Frankia sp. AgB1.9]MBL7622337.1 diguanylate cyclase [Frankia sp. AgB1.8]